MAVTASSGVELCCGIKISQSLRPGKWWMLRESSTTSGAGTSLHRNDNRRPLELSYALWQKDGPRIQILTIEEILNGKGIEMPTIQQVSQTFKKARREKKSAASQQMDLLE